MGIEIDSRSALRDLIAGLTSWQAWTGLSDLQSRKDRISWPEVKEDKWPFAVVLFGSGARVNLLGSDSSANFRSRAVLRVLVFDKCSSPDNLEAADTLFGTRFFGLLDDLVDNAHTGPLMIEQISYEDVPYVLSGLNTTNARDDDADGVDDDHSLETLFYTGVFSVSLGVA